MSLPSEGAHAPAKHNRYNSSWTPDRREKALELRKRGWSALEIAMELGHFEYTPDHGRNAVIGFLCRADAYILDSPLWSEDRVDILRQKWAAGELPQAIATRLGIEFTRNMVMSKARWLHLQRRDRLTFRAIRPKRSVPAKPLPSTPQSDLQIPQEQRRSLIELEHHHCRWPVGDPGESNFFFCGAGKLSEGPYCASHARRAYQ